MAGDYDFIVCKNCETPCYMFDLDRKGNIQSAFCTLCGNDDVTEFRLPDADETGVDE
ncbi:MAG: hypothetical protein IT186_18690 [Acidobacteria bacterium]|nr:hypothetical protein [Acidobacteriota bacterium]MCG3192922.1 hypothetical protein [Thermoanaerobaculia bacterium]MCK6683811.1 hypothetical protein [Thermoanaerobaculia bacterium]